MSPLELNAISMVYGEGETAVRALAMSSRTSTCSRDFTAAVRRP
jgi:hypothetical protein